MLRSSNFKNDVRNDLTRLNLASPAPLILLTAYASKRFTVFDDYGYARASFTIPRIACVSHDESLIKRAPQFFKLKEARY